MWEEKKIQLLDGSGWLNAIGRISGPSGAAAKLGIPRSTLESKSGALGLASTG
jgi:hypothetical protein